MRVIKENVFLNPSEMCFVQYMPIKFPEDYIYIPDNLLWVKPIIDSLVSNDPGRFDFYWDYIYLTVKYLYTERGSLGNRPGWHIDGYDSEDTNYVWCDRNPTEYILSDIGYYSDHKEALEACENIATVAKRFEIPCNSIVDMERTIHRVKEDIDPGMRAFVKISISRHKYNLQGNANNPLRQHDWKMYPREISRNHPYVLEN